MKTIIGVNVNDSGKVEYYYAEKEEVSVGDYIVAKTHQGTMMGKVIIKDAQLDKKQSKHRLKKIIRKATEKDFQRRKEIQEREEKAFKICRENIIRLGIPMRLIKVSGMFDGHKIIFYFTADGRVDFRDLVRILANEFKTRIELRQVGVRDKAKLVGGLGACGHGFCCKKFLSDFQPVSIKMAKDQGLSLNPGKVTGICGRLMCCLKYEQKNYEEMLKESPKVGTLVKTEDGKGIVTEINLLSKTVKVSLLSGENLRPKVYNTSDIEIIKDVKVALSKRELKALCGTEDD